MITKSCSLCHVEKPLDDFHNHPYTLDKKQSHCKVCSKKEAMLSMAASGYAAQRKWSKNNRDKVNSNNRNNRAIKKLKKEGMI